MAEPHSLTTEAENETAGETFHDGDLLLNIKGLRLKSDEKEIYGTHKAATGHHPGCICVALGRIVSSSRPQQGCSMLRQATIQAATGHQFETAVGLHQTAAYNHPNKSVARDHMENSKCSIQTVTSTLFKVHGVHVWLMWRNDSSISTEFRVWILSTDVQALRPPLAFSNQLKSLLLLHIEAPLLLKTLDDMYSGY
ncbi:hypothetical protein E3N88_10243 [Mikania micrantha]|uniref:Uncharacterized protein n=1 Tax=Mikania micrantha TaxID=192012 RepID=A0A5N6PBU1_9ASTR|nr:hypothetical protein E3N88_10243 [Mikania micrantha]